ncbi:MAG: undecaprenyl-diphosphate phosphatase [Clostridia bacterium]|nr:undecaprenyl-diphosphate phosphatase [Clostridia bacterium]
MFILDWLKAILYGIIEGITEWLPVSSTGHLILIGDLLPFTFSKDAVFMAEFYEMFEVVVQLGAILAVIVLFWGRLWPFSKNKNSTEKRNTWSLWGKVVVGCIPAAFAGIVLDKILEIATGKDINGWLYNSVVVAVMLIVYGVAFIAVEHFNRNRKPTVESTDALSYKTAFLIGLFQTLSLIPGTSRSGSTILGSMLLGTSRTAGAEFSFFMSIPVMAGAGGIKMLGFFKYIGESGVSVPIDAWITLAIGCAVSFVVSLVAIRFLMDFVKRHSFAPFGVYRIALGALVLLFWLVR